MRIAELFETLNTPLEKRNQLLRDELNQFRYINGKLFDAQLRFAAFDSKMRKTLLDCCAFDWSKISPAIFGAMF